MSKERLRCDFCDRIKILGTVEWNHWPICRGCANNYPNSESWKRLRYQIKYNRTWAQRIAWWASQTWTEIKMGLGRNLFAGVR